MKKKLGNQNRLPDYPFNEKMTIAVFPALDDDLVDQNLYNALYSTNEIIGNTSFIIKAAVGTKGVDTATLQQKTLNWTAFDQFQYLPLVHKGFYMTGENIDWLGIYHVDDYIVIGGSNEFIAAVCHEMYGNEDWLAKFEKAFEDGRMNMYKDDYDAIKEKLLNKRQSSCGSTY